MSSPLHAIIVGGSLAGLTSALALAGRGLDVTVLERTGRTPRSGGAVGVDPAHLLSTTGVGSRDGRDGFTAESWQGLHARLTAAAEQHPGIAIRHESPVEVVGEDDRSAWACADGRVLRGDVLIGADGHRSLVRGAIAPDNPDAEFAGYVLWIGIAREQDIPPVRRWPTAPDILDGDGAMLIGYPLEGADGSRAEGERRLGWAWFDASRNALLRETGAVRDGVVRHSLRPSSIPEATLVELAMETSRWPQPWRAAIEETVQRRLVTGVPIAEYVPRRLVSPRMALVGNAAHVPTPMTGKGFDASLEDAAALARVLQKARAAEVPAALAQYEKNRINEVAGMVRSGHAFSRRFGRG